MTKYLRIFITVIVVIAAVFAGRWIWTDYMHTPWTRDGRIRAEIVTVSPDVSGWVTKLNIKDGQSIKKGDLLLVLMINAIKRRLIKVKPIPKMPYTHGSLQSTSYNAGKA